jgi:type IV pilus assembly protein PilY1
VKLAAVNGGTLATDRRFFNAPDVVRTSYAGAAFDAILIGSGDRTNPNEMDDPNDPNKPAADNQFYMFRDRAINPYFTEAPTSSDCNATPPSVDFRCQLPLDPNDLYDATSNIIQTGTADQKAAAQAALAARNGWRLDLQADPDPAENSGNPLARSGEKALSRAITIGGNVYFTTFTPEPSDTQTCNPVPGTGRLYVVNLINAAADETFNSNTNTKRFWEIGYILPDTPSPHFGSDGEIRLLLPPGSGGSGEISSPFLTGASIPGPYGSYWYREDY